MASYGGFQPPFILPKLKYTFKTDTETERFVFYDVKFFPYENDASSKTVFAIAAQKKIYIGALSDDGDAMVTMLHELIDEQETNDRESSGLNSCAWCYTDPEQPLLAVAGQSGQLKIIDTIAGDVLTTLVGHGHGTINDIATHPLYPWIVATASMDKSVRIWDLRRHTLSDQSHTIIICGQATGHSEGVLTASWHSSGRYLITGGHDQRVCVWTMPDLRDGSSFWQEIAPENRKRSSHEVKIIHFPHFTSSAVHSDFVDCARFFGDLVMSKAANEEKIVLWKITGFDHKKHPPSSTTAPKTEEYLDTRNGFMRIVTRNKNGVETVQVAPEFEDEPPYERLLEFETPNSATFYLRFALLLPSPTYPDIHPTLAFGNEATELRFWDLERMALGYARGIDENKSTAAKKKKKTATTKFKHSSTVSRTLGSEQDSPANMRESTVSSISNMSSGPWGPRQSSTEATSEISDDNGLDMTFPMPNRKRYPIDDPHKPIKYHEKILLNELQFKKQRPFLTRAADWSPCGRWCIAVGESTKAHNQGWGGFAVLRR